MRGRRARVGFASLPRRYGRMSVADPARSREVGVATEMFLTKGEQVSDDADGPPDYACCGSAGPVGRHTLAAIPALRITPHDAAAVHVRLVFAQGFATGARLVLNSGLGPS